MSENVLRLIKRKRVYLAEQRNSYAHPATLTHLYCPRTYTLLKFQNVSPTRDGFLRLHVSAEYKG